jgi:hypothetical protein
MGHKPERQRRNRSQHRRVKKTAKAVTTPAWSPGSPLHEAADVIRANNNAPRLLKRLADTLNKLEEYGIAPRLAHGAVITHYGYVLPIASPGEDQAWQVRTRQLTEFSLLPASTASEDDD